MCNLQHFSLHKKEQLISSYLFYCYFGEKCLKKITRNRANGIQKQLQKKENVSDKISQKFSEKYRARFTVVLQYSLSEQVRSERDPFTTAGHAMWLICESTLQVLCYKRRKKI